MARWPHARGSYYLLASENVTIVLLGDPSRLTFRTCSNNTRLPFFTLSLSLQGRFRTTLPIAPPHFCVLMSFCRGPYTSNCCRFPSKCFFARSFLAYVEDAVFIAVPFAIAHLCSQQTSVLRCFPGRVPSTFHRREVSKNKVLFFQLYCRVLARNQKQTLRAGSREKSCVPFSNVKAVLVYFTTPLYMWAGTNKTVQKDAGRCGVHIALNLNHPIFKLF